MANAVTYRQAAGWAIAGRNSPVEALKRELAEALLKRAARADDELRGRLAAATVDCWGCRSGFSPPVWLTTQPMEEPEDRERLPALGFR
jgi:hypothetical protein